jgi:predicted permease
MRLSLELVVIAIVILVVAIVILAFFGMGVQQANQITDARNQCIITASASCQSIGAMPPIWEIETVRVGNDMWSCDELTNKHDCDEFKT